MKRSRLEICIDVLKAIKKGCKKPTRIMYSSNISWIPLNEILNFLVNQNAVIVKQTGKKKEYYITNRGEEILEYYEQFKSKLARMHRESPSLK